MVGVCEALMKKYEAEYNASAFPLLEADLKDMVELRTAKANPICFLLSEILYGQSPFTDSIRSCTAEGLLY